MPESMYLQEGGWSQRKQRSEQMFTDQHGREYHATIELKSGHPTGPIQPLYQAPLAVPMKYLELSKDKRRPYDLRINYEAWVADLRTGRQEWEAEARKLARALYRDKYDPSDAFTTEVLTVVGPPPQHVEPVIAARQGNKYVLGLTDRVDVRLYAMLQEDKPSLAGESEPDFSEVLEADDELDALDDAEEQRKEAIRAQDRERKRLKREADKQAAQAA